MEQHSSLEVKLLDGLEVSAHGGPGFIPHTRPEVSPYGRIEVAHHRNLQRYNYRDTNSYNELLDNASTLSQTQGRMPGETVTRLWGLSIKRFWLIMGTFAFTLVATITIVGGVLGTRPAAAQDTKDNIASSSPPTSLSSASTGIGRTTTHSDIPTTAPSFSSTATSYASWVTYSASVYPVNQKPAMATLSAGGTTTYIGCPNSNNTVWEDAGTGLRFLRRCGANYVAHDITSRIAYSLEDCMTLCARDHVDTNCTAVVWMWGWNGYVNERVAQFNYCYLKDADYNVPSNLYWTWQAEFGFIIS